MCVCDEDTEECVELGEPSRSMMCWGMEGKGGIASGRSGGEGGGSHVIPPRSQSISSVRSLAQDYKTHHSTHTNTLDPGACTKH